MPADAEDIKRRTGKWQLVLYVINGVTAALGIILMGIAGWAKNSEQSLALPTWTLNVLLAFGLIVMVISFLGLYGAWKAPDKIDNKKVNWFLWLYFVVMFLAIILELAAAGVLLVLSGTIKDAQNGDLNNTVRAFEDELRKLIRDNKDQWIDVQKYFDCCGYNCTNQCDFDCTNDYPTGPLCSPTLNSQNQCIPTPDYIPSCRNLLLDKAQQQATALGAVAIVFALFELLAFVAAFCLLCCVKVDYEIE